MEHQPLLDIEEGELGEEEVISSMERVPYLPVRQEEGTIINEPCIFRVHEGLRRVNANAYTPILVSIGPYHHGKDEFLEMEEHKERYLQLLLERTNQDKELYLQAMNKLESKARKCYAANSFRRNDKEKFVEMMLLDGCFVIEFLRKSSREQLRDKDDPIFKASWMQVQICRDLMLLENQLPFSVLFTLFDMTETSRDGCDPLLILAGIPVSDVVPADHSIPRPLTTGREPKHFLDLVLHHGYLYPSFTDDTSSSNNNTCMEMPCVMELQEAGVDFKVEEANANIFDIKFERGQLKMPNFTVSDSTEGFFRNMIAYEQHSPDAEPQYFTDFICFLDLLIDSKEDVSKLRRCGIIDNMLGNDEEVAHMINKLGDGMLISPSYTYSKLCKKVNKHCDKCWNKEMAKLRRNYFTNPWVTVSTVAAGLLLFLTLTQTVVALMTLLA